MSYLDYLDEYLMDKILRMARILYVKELPPNAKINNSVMLKLSEDRRNLFLNSYKRAAHIDSYNDCMRCAADKHLIYDIFHFYRTNRCDGDVNYYVALVDYLRAKRRYLSLEENHEGKHLL